MAHILAGCGQESLITYIRSSVDETSYSPSKRWPCGSLLYLFNHWTISIFPEDNFIERELPEKGKLFFLFTKYYLHYAIV